MAEEQKWQPFNINHTARVKLTAKGRAHLATSDWKHIPIREDAEGWSEWQLWTLFEAFGALIYMGADLPFETAIELRIEP